MELPKIEKRLEFKLGPNNETDMYIYGGIGGWWGITAEEIKDQLANIKSNVINVHINSGGGSAFDGAAIYNLLKQHASTIHVYIDGVAASAASEIAMAGDKIFMPKNTMMMVHKAWTFAAGNCKELEKTAVALRKLDTAMAEAYAARFVGERAELDVLLDEETWLTADECKELGFCDEVIELKDVDTDNEVSAEAKADYILNKYISNFAANTDRKTKISNAKEQQKAFNANIMCKFLENLYVKKGE